MRALLICLAALLLLAAQPGALPAQAAGRPSAPSDGHGRGSGARKPRINKRAEHGQPAKPPPPTNLPSAAPRLSTLQLGALQGIVQTLSRTSSRLAKDGPPRRLATLPAAEAVPPPTRATPPKPKLGEAIHESLDATASAKAQREAEAARAAEEARLAEAARVAEEARRAEELQLAEARRLAQEAEAARQAQEAEAAQLKAEQERLAREAEAARQQSENEQRARERLEKQQKEAAEDEARGKAASAGAEAAGKAADASRQLGAEAGRDEQTSQWAEPQVDQRGASKEPDPPPVEAGRSNPGGRAKPPAETETEPRAPRDSGLDFLSREREPEAAQPETALPDPLAPATKALDEPPAEEAAEANAGASDADPEAGLEQSGIQRGRFAVSGPLNRPDLSEQAAAMLPAAAQTPPEEHAAAMLDPAPLAPAPGTGVGASLYFTLTPARPRELVLAPMLGPGGAPPAKAPTSLVLPGKPVMPDASIPKGMDSIQRAKTKRKVVALTLDDGPHPEYTSQILSTLQRHKVRATFDLVGVQCMKNPQWVKMIAQAGHELASHTFDHFRLPKLPLDEKAYQIDENQRLIGQLTGVTPRFLRPPGGQSDPEVERLCRERGMVVALWDVGLNDLAVGRSARDLAATALADTRPGSILLAHDGSQALIDALPAIIEGLRAKGYEFVTLSELASAR